MTSTNSRLLGLRTMFGCVTLATALLALPAPFAAAAAPDLFISEYVEGSSFNKAIEIHNGTGIPVDLSAYTLQLYSNGAASPSASASLTGMLADGDVYIVAHPSASAAILSVADQLSSTVINFNGDDAVVLRKGSTVIDAFGRVGFDPGSEWIGGGLDDTLRRKTSVCQGDPNELDPFDASVEWNSFANNTFDGLGVHSCDETPTVIINEVDADTEGTDNLEFVELYDGGSGNTDLSGLTLVFYNGSNDLSYAAFDLDGFSTDANGYFVLGNAGVNPAPSIIFGANLLQNGADAVALFEGDAASFPNGTALTTTGLIDAIVYDTSDADDAGLLALLHAGQPQVDEAGALDPAADSSQRCPNGSGGPRNTESYAQFAPTAGAQNTCTPPLPACGAAVSHLIHQIQGSGPTSPVAGSVVAVEAVVVGDFQNNAAADDGNLDGFYLQEEDAEADTSAATSEGIFVFAPGAADVSVGDRVRVEGVVSEFNGLTEIASPSVIAVCSSGNTLPTPATVSLPVNSLADFEAFEGMGVVLPQELVIAEYFNYDRFGEIVLSVDRQVTPTALVEPGPAAVALAAQYALSRITLDDGRSVQNPDPAVHPNGSVFDLGNRFRGGDRVSNVTGVLDFAFGLYRIQPTQGASVATANPRTVTPDAVGGSLEVASFNVLNYFTTIDTGAFICGPAGNQECRGADDAVEFTRQRDKIIAALSAMSSDVVGLIEIENHPADVPTADLVAGLNAALGAGTYDYVATGAIGTDAIRMALIYKPASVTPLGDFAILDTSVDARFVDTLNRPALAQTFQNNLTGGIFTLAINHLKSKGSDCNAVSDPDLGDGAGNCNLTRKAAAEALVDWLASDPTGSGDPDFLIMGDLNSYDKEDPIDAILAGANGATGDGDDYTDLIRAQLGEPAYSYVFDGQTGYLDHALAGPELVADVTGTTVWHINADEPDLIDYDTSFKQPAQDALYAPDPYRSSDHDPVIVGLDVCDELAPTLDVTVTPNVLRPPNHKYVTVHANVTVDDNFDASPTVTMLSVTSNEPDNGADDGDTVDDMVVVDDYQFKLRAERSGSGTGRIYTITYAVTDACGNETIQSATVAVPKGS